MALGRSAFYTGSEEQSKPISFELACASEMQKFWNTEKNEYAPLPSLYSLCSYVTHATQQVNQYKDLNTEFEKKILL